MSTPRVSVVVPVYNGARTIADCIDSVLQSSWPRSDLELLLVDNNSTDATGEVLSRYRDRAILLQEPTQGPAAARNRGLASATGDVIAFTDADCVVHSDWIREIVAPLGDPSVGIVGGTILARRPCNAIEQFGERIHDHRMAIEVYTPPYAITMNWASRRAVLDKVGFFDEKLLRCEDCDLAWRVVQAGYRIVHAPSAVIYHRNEKTLLGLMAEGYAHGYHSIPLLRKHNDFVRGFAASAPSRRAPVAPASPSPPPRNESLYWRAFNLGKAAGRRVAKLAQRT